VETEVQQIIVALVALGALGLAYVSGAWAADTSSGPWTPPPDFYEEMGKASHPHKKPHLLAKAPAAPAVDWTGYYVGADAGAAWARTPGTWNPQPSPAAFGTFPISATDHATSLVAGGHVGYNSQFAPEWVTGVEGDWTWTEARGSFTQPWIADPAAAPVATTGTTMNTKLDWLASIRGRFGYLVTPNVMAYATAGAAWARIDDSANSARTSNGYFASVAQSQTATGFAAGGGLEWALTNEWFVRAEYLYYRFGSGPTLLGASAVFPTFPSSYSWGHTTINVARAGVSYKF
jgi:outer membrane immunogenic protein